MCSYELRYQLLRGSRSLWRGLSGRIVEEFLCAIVIEGDLGIRKLKIQSQAIWAYDRVDVSAEESTEDS